MSDNLSSGFLNGRYVPSMRLNVTSHHPFVVDYPTIHEMKKFSI